MIAGVPIWVAILVALGIPTALITIVGAVIKALEYRRDRKTAREDRQAQKDAERDGRDDARQDKREDRAESWNDQVRTNIERHIPWDARVLAHVERLELLVNDLREGQGKTPVVFPVLGSPPDLFPAGVAPPRDDA